MLCVGFGKLKVECYALVAFCSHEANLNSVQTELQCPSVRVQIARKKYDLASDGLVNRQQSVCSQ